MSIKSSLRKGSKKMEDRKEESDEPLARTFDSMEGLTSHIDRSTIPKEDFRRVRIIHVPKITSLA